MRVFTLLLALSFSFLTKAASVPETTYFTNSASIVSPEADVRPVKAKKLSRFQKWELKIIKKKLSRLGIEIDEDHLPTPHQRKLGKLSMIFGIGSIVAIFVVPILALPLAVAGLVLGIKSVKGNSNGQGIAGIVTSSVTLALILVAIILIAAFFAAWGG